MACAAAIAMNQCSSQCPSTSRAAFAASRKAVLRLRPGRRASRPSASAAFRAPNTASTATTDSAPSAQAANCSVASTNAAQASAFQRCHTTTAIVAVYAMAR